MLQEIFCYIAFCGLPCWHGYVYTIDVSKHLSFTQLINSGQFEKAEKFLISKKFMVEFFKDEVPTKLQAQFAGFSWPEYMKCFTDACYNYLLEVYLQKKMFLEANRLSKSEKWWGKTFLLYKTENDLAKSWFKSMPEVPPNKIHIDNSGVQQVLQLFRGHYEWWKDLAGPTKIPLMGTEYATNVYGLTDGLLAASFAYRQHLEAVKYRNLDYSKCG